MNHVYSSIGEKNPSNTSLVINNGFTRHTTLKVPQDCRSPGEAAIMPPRYEGLLTDPSEYDVIEIIGNGTYGTVYKARNPNNLSGEFVALKKLQVSLEDGGIPISVLREISILRLLGRDPHDNIVRLLDVCHGGMRLEEEQQLAVFLVFEHVEQDLHRYLERCCPPEGLSEAQIRYLMLQTLRGVDFMHSNRVLHRDLKPQNILVTSNGEVKLADFGLSRLYVFKMNLTPGIATLWYRAPEVLLNCNYATPVDLWSVGCIFAELYRRMALFPGQSEFDQLNKIFDVIGTPKPEEWSKDTPFSRESFQQRTPVNLRRIIPNIDPVGEDLLLSLLTFAPDSRISASRALLHPYLVGINRLSLEDTSLTHQRSPIPGPQWAAAAGMTPTTVSGAAAPELTLVRNPIQTHRPPLHHLMVDTPPQQQSNYLSDGTTSESPSSSANSGPFPIISSSPNPYASLSTSSEDSGQSMCDVI